MFTFSKPTPISDAKTVFKPPLAHRSLFKTRKLRKPEQKGRDDAVVRSRSGRSHLTDPKDGSSFVGTPASSNSSSVYAELVNPNLVYTFRVVQFNTITASVNVITGYQNIDPTTGNEWSSIAALFSVFRVVAAKLTVIPTNSGSTSVTNGRPWLAVSPEVGLSSTAGASGQAVMDGPGARIISLLPGMNHKDYQFDFPHGTLPLMWQAIGGSGQEPWAGGWGEFQFYGQTAGASDSYQTAIEIFVEVSGRT